MVNDYVEALQKTQAFSPDFEKIYLENIQDNSAAHVASSLFFH